MLKEIIKRNPGKVLELYVWEIIAIIISLPEIVYVSSRRVYFYDFLREPTLYDKFITSIFIMLFPIIFKLIFEYYPLEYLKNRRKIREQGYKNNTIIINNPSENVSITNDNSDSQEIKEKKEEIAEILKLFYEESDGIANKIYNRSGVYLLFGSLISIGGVLMFNYPLFVQVNVRNDATIITQLIEYLPRFGALFFIEFIAFFFLKQYRIMMEEYRYYERLKRKRQDNFSIIKIITKYKDNEKLVEMILNKYLIENSKEKISSDETTEILETQKISNEEMNIFDKITDLVKAVKK